MSPERILIPVDIGEWPVEVFSVANAFARKPGATVILLHVVNLNIAAPENRVYPELGREAHWHLDRLARGCWRPGISIITRVRFGKPAEEILAEAAERNVDLIVLASKPPSLLRRLFAPLVPRVVERVVREASCGVFLTNAKKRFNCESIGGRPTQDYEAGVALASEGLVREQSSEPLAEAAFASAQSQGSVTV